MLFQIHFTWGINIFLVKYASMINFTSLTVIYSIYSSKFPGISGSKHYSQWKKCAIQSLHWWLTSNFKTNVSLLQKQSDIWYIFVSDVAVVIPEHRGEQSIFQVHSKTPQVPFRQTVKALFTKNKWWHAVQCDRLSPLSVLSNWLYTFIRKPTCTAIFLAMLL